MARQITVGMLAAGLKGLPDDAPILIATADGLRPVREWWSGYLGSDGQPLASGAAASVQQGYAVVFTPDK